MDLLKFPNPFDSIHPGLYTRRFPPDIKPYPKELGAYGILCDRIPSLSAQIDIDIDITRRRLFQLNDTKQLV